jgi:hypothetical protein
LEIPTEEEVPEKDLKIKISVEKNLYCMEHQTYILDTLWMNNLKKMFLSLSWRWKRS